MTSTVEQTRELGPDYIRWAIAHYGKVPFDLGSSGVASVGLDQLLTQLEGYEGPDLFGRARASIASLYSPDPSGMHAVDPNRVTLAFGASHACILAMAGTLSSSLSQGDEACVETPYYAPLLSAAASVGARVTLFPRDPETYALDLDRVFDAITPRTKLVAVTNLHNPSGIRTPRAVLEELATRLLDRGIYLLVDEVYSPYDALEYPLPAPLEMPNVLVASSLTKTLGLGNHRIGWLLTPAGERGHALRKHVDSHLFNTIGHYPGVYMKHVIDTIARLGEVKALSHFATGKETLKRKRETVARWMRTREDLHWSDPKEGVFGFARMKSGTDLRARIEQGFVKEQVVVGAGSFFGVPNGFRLSWVIEESKLAEGLTRLGSVLDHVEKA